MSENRRFPFS